MRYRSAAATPIRFSRRQHLLWLAAGSFAAVAHLAHAAEGAADAVTLDTVVVTATHVSQSAFDLPASIDVVGQAAIRDAQPTVNLSEPLARVPGVVVQNRQNYAQDLQVSVRGFGARSTFGVRGVRLYVDGIPATMPDGQGQTSHIDLASAGRIEVLRGPYSVLYGNASGGTIAVFSEDGKPGNQLEASVAGGSYGSSKVGIKAGGLQQGVNYLIDANRFETDGYRAHSAATRDLANARLSFAVGEAGVLSLVANGMNMQETQDPLGLSRAQFEADPRQADASAVRFNTRKSVRQQQAGANYQVELGQNDSVHASIYLGERATTQFQAIPKASQLPPTSPGGVIDLQRQYQGLDANWTHRFDTLPLYVVAGINAEYLDEDRKGYENFIGEQLGVQGRMRRNEINRVNNVDQYLQLQWEPGTQWLLNAGLRNSSVHIRSADHYITPGNGDDSGGVDYRHLGGALGATWRATDAFNLYAAYGQGFETPTLNELSYRSTSGLTTGLNLGLQPAESDHYELGAKARLGNSWQMNVALFHIDTHNEIATFANAGGRAVYQNVARTRRDGLEIGAQGSWGNGFSSSVAYSWLRAEYAEAFKSCATTPCVPVQIAAGNRIPGVPQSSFFGDLVWQAQPDGPQFGLEAVYGGRMFVNDLNSDSRAAYLSFNAKASLQQRAGAWRFKEYLRIDNLLGKDYAGSVIVNESNGRYFEPAPGRNVFAGVNATLDW
ncbi:Colicin I receptor [Andreprevotia sp. IGB-42]|uniref:TonB-dependent receptor family protein n=1 Tax=Andreprevotia sp. IGB-42 TaxID=2497473 RepID=UPI00157EF48E|nr:TonB-dependent receptor [Andreprevotia sp. IGB-42]KAF0814902.1 Colicin I receptor [Andreprevotia sp. IGB-42]